MKEGDDMLEFFEMYGGSIIVGLIVLAIVALIVIGRVKDKRAGKSSCGCDCAHCGACCHSSDGEHKHTKQ